MTTYTFYKDHIEMEDITDKHHRFFHSDEDLTFILSCLRADFFMLTGQIKSPYRSRYIRCYNFLLDIKSMCHTSITSSEHVVHLVRDILVFMPQRSFSNFRFIIKD